MESSDGDTVALINNKQQLDALLASLNTKGPREAALAVTLRRRYGDLLDALQPPTAPLDVAETARPVAATGAVKHENGVEGSEGDGNGVVPYARLKLAAEAAAVQGIVAGLEGVVANLVSNGVLQLGVKVGKEANCCNVSCI